MVLVRQSRLLEAKRIVQRLGGHSIDADLFVIQIEETIEYDERNAASSFYFDCFRGTKVRRRMIAAVVFVPQQSSGVFSCLGSGVFSSSSPGFPTNQSFNLGVGVSGIWHYRESGLAVYGESVWEEGVVRLGSGRLCHHQSAHGVLVFGKDTVWELVNGCFHESETPLPTFSLLRQSPLFPVLQALLPSPHSLPLLPL
jgi:hypothetical protein